jgi:hypothetical protein
LSGLVVQHPPAIAADPAMDTVLAAKAALKRAVQVRDAARTTFTAAQQEVELIRALVARLEGDRR